MMAGQVHAAMRHALSHDVIIVVRRTAHTRRFIFPVSANYGHCSLSEYHRHISSSGTRICHLGPLYFCGVICRSHVCKQDL